ncbi:N-acetylneuraminate synthase family protein [Bacteroidia bacterium]|jgi:3-deoxy-D-glycero-D-galacto-nononate 9-phosphate synthase|nr:N-acetylneuraminate synthase family protein [Bacteroidia bacterium]
MKNTYIIGEIGQNHNGSIDIAKKLIDVVAQPVVEHLFDLDLKRMDAVKLTKRDLSEELTNSAMQRPYDSPHSFGKTYGEHREFLELSDEQHFELYKYAKSKGLDFVETLCAVGCLSMINLFEPDRLKVASRDLTNLPLLNALAETKIPIILSTGMGGKQEIDDAIDTISKYHSNISILHCISEYPAHYKNINLLTIKWMQEHYSAYTIGYSDHSIGIDIPLAAVALGSEILEKHITLDREMKGTDQAGSLGPDGIYRMVRDVRCLERAMGEKKINVDPAVESARIKLERSIASKRPLKKGEIITLEDIHVLSPGDGFKWKQKEDVIGKKATEDIPANEIIYKEMLQ